MKRNAILRIIIWSICLVLLCSMLIGMLCLRAFRIRSQNNTEYMEVTSPNSSAQNYLDRTALDEINVRREPKTDGSVVGILHTGDVVKVQKEEVVQQIPWLYITSPVEGWVQSQYISPEIQVAIGIPDREDGTFAFDASKIHSLEIEWVAGHIQILPAETDEIAISESAVSDSCDAFVWSLKDGRISIDFCEEEYRFFGFGNHTYPKKDLTIYVPMDWECRSLEIDAASAHVTVQALTAREADFDGASGDFTFTDCIFDKLDVDTVSGNITFDGILRVLECDAVSANVRAVLSNVPNMLDLESLSGDLDITLPEDAGFTLNMDSMQEKFSTDFQNPTVQNGNYIFGDGGCRINVSAMSGNVSIRKASE